ncbi:MAG: hypothetical protein Q8Q12_09240 [bacterium]|nr:hypothetical protein [bacterium]
MSTNPGAKPHLQEPIKAPARPDWPEVTRVSHYYLAVDAVTQPIKIEDRVLYGVRET